VRTVIASLPQLVLTSVQPLHPSALPLSRAHVAGGCPGDRTGLSSPLCVGRARRRLRCCGMGQQHSVRIESSCRRPQSPTLSSQSSVSRRSPGLKPTVQPSWLTIHTRPVSGATRRGARWLQWGLASTIATTWIPQPRWKAAQRSACLESSRPAHFIARKLHARSTSSSPTSASFQRRQRCRHGLHSLEEYEWEAR